MSTIEIVFLSVAFGAVAMLVLTFALAWAYNCGQTTFKRDLLKLEDFWWDRADGDLDRINARGGSQVCHTIGTPTTATKAEGGGRRKKAAKRKTAKKTTSRKRATKR